MRSPSRANDSTPTSRITSIPSSSSAACNSAAASASARAAICGPWFTIVTREPKRAKICANSRPTGPAPTTSSDSGICSSSSALTWSIQSTSSMPGTGGTAVREPAAIRMRSAVSSRSPTRTVSRPRTTPRRGRPRNRRLVSTSTQLSCVRRSESFHARTRARSTSAGPQRTPIQSLSSLTLYASSAATRYAFVGRHATFGQLPPQRTRSMSATRAPWSRDALRGAVACSRAGADDDEIEVFSHAADRLTSPHALRSRRGDDAERGTARRGAPRGRRGGVPQADRDVPRDARARRAHVRLDAGGGGGRRRRRPGSPSSRGSTASRAARR